MDILLTGQSISSYNDWNTDVERWTTAAAYQEYSKLTKINKVFAMHWYEENTEIDTVNLFNYPLKEIVSKFDVNYFTSTVAYMLAYAGYLGIKEIRLFGCDMNSKEEYHIQKPCVMDWIGYLRGLGVKVDLINGIDNANIMYGYNNTTEIRKKLDFLKKWSLAKAEQESDYAVKNQWLGQANGFDVVLREL